MSSEDEKTLRDQVMESDLFLHALKNLTKEEKDQAIDFALGFASESQKSMDSILKVIRTDEGKKNLVKSFTRFMLNPSVIKDAD